MVKTAMSITRQILTAVYVCHVPSGLRRDLKPANVLAAAWNRIPLADFGLAQKIPPKERRGRQTPRVITVWYRPLELLLQCRNYAEEVDVWSLGCIFYEMITARPPCCAVFSSSNDEAQNELLQAMEIVRVCGPPEAAWPEVTSLPGYEMIRGAKERGPGMEEFLNRNLPKKFDEAKPLLLKMLKIRPSDRCTVREALEDPFLRNIDGCLEADRLPMIRVPEAHSKTGLRSEGKKEGAAGIKGTRVGAPRPKPTEG